VIQSVVSVHLFFIRALAIVLLVLAAGKAFAQPRFSQSFGFSFLSGAITGPAARVPDNYSLYRYDTQPFLPPYVHSWIKVDRFVPDGGRVLLGFTYTLNYRLLKLGSFSTISLNASPALDLNDFNVSATFGTISLPVFAGYNFGAGSGRNTALRKGFHVGFGWQALAGGLFFSQKLSGNAMQFWSQPVVRAGVRWKNAKGSLRFVDLYFGIPQQQKSFRAMLGVSPTGSVITENGVYSPFVFPDEGSPLPFDNIYNFVTNLNDQYLAPQQTLEPVFAERFEGPFYYDRFWTRCYFKVVVGFTLFPKQP
jgi:hypothetical protein